MSHKEILNRELVVTGSSARDFISVVPSIALLGHGEHNSVSILAKDLFNASGGTAANIAYGIASLGVEVQLLASVGADYAVDRQRLNQHGVGVDHLHTSDLNTATFLGIVDDAGGQIGVFYPGAMSDSEALTFLPWANKSAFAIISAHDPKAMLRQVTECQESSIPYCFDPGQQVNNSKVELLQAGIRGANILMVNRKEMAVICQRLETTPEALYEQIPLVITTLGGDGVRFDGSDSPHFTLPACAVTEVTDPTGAGDAFRGGFFAGLSLGKTLREAGLMGAVNAAYCIEVRGPQNYRYSQSEFDTRLQDWQAGLRSNE